MGTTDKLLTIGGLLGGRGPANVMVAEGKGAATVVAEAGAYKTTAANVARMKSGKPPIGKDGKAIELHHTNQDPKGALVEMTMTEHRGKGNFNKNHPFG